MKLEPIGQRVQITFIDDRQSIYGAVIGHGFMGSVCPEPMYLVEIDQEFRGYLADNRLFVSILVAHPDCVKPVI